MRLLILAVIVGWLIVGCHKDGDQAIACIDLNVGTPHEALFQIAGSLADTGFWKIERSLPSNDGAIPNIGLYRLDNTKVYLVGERIAHDGSIWPPASISFYGNADNEKLPDWLNYIFDLLEANNLEFEANCGTQEAQERTVYLINKWRSRRAQDEGLDEAD